MHAIDAHCHIWTPDTTNYALGPGYWRAHMVPLSFTKEQLIAEMEQVDVDKVVLIQMSFYGYDNSYMLDAIKAHPDKFRGVGVIEQDAGDPTAAMLELQARGCTGFRIYPKDRDFDDWLSSDTMTSMWKITAERQLNLCCLMDPVGLPALDRMCHRFPETPVVIDHMCRIGITGDFPPADVEALCNMARHQQVTVKVSAFYGLGRKMPPYTDLGPVIQQLLSAFGRERLMWASDGPYQMQQPHSYKASVDLIRSGLPFLTDDDKTWLLRKTAERVFFS